MLDQEIDALLVGALYGELGPAEEARLAAHLESHPTDRSALEDLRSMRSRLVESRYFELQLDPPPAVSVLLVQEAARRAPRVVVASDRDDEGWFGRFVRSFFAHPAAAAAAMLVVVVGVAGTMYFKKGASLAEPSAAERSEVATKSAAAQSPSPEVAATTVSADLPNRAAPGGGAAAGSAAAAPEPGSMADYLSNGNAPAVGGAVAAQGDGINVKVIDSPKAGDQQALAMIEQKNDGKPAPVAHAAKPSPERQKGLYVADRDQQPKDLEGDDGDGGVGGKDAKEVNATVAGNTAPAATGAASGGGGGAYRSADESRKAPPAAQVAPAGPGYADLGTATPTTPTSTTSTTAAPQQQGQTSWARDQHARVTALVRAGKCQDAASVAVEIKARAPEYYNSYVANDRSLKQCMQYIAGAVERSAEPSPAPAKAKAAKAAPSPPAAADKADAVK